MSDEIPRSELIKQLKTQRMISKVIADRLALCLTWFHEEAIESWLEEGSEAMAYFDALRTCITKQDDASLYKQAQLRASDFNKTAMEEVRQMTRDILVSIKTEERVK